MKPRVDWTEQETRQFEIYLRAEYDKDPHAHVKTLVARAMVLVSKDRRRSDSTPKIITQAGEFLRNGTPLSSRATGPSTPPKKEKAETAAKATRVGEEGKQPSPPIITKLNNGAAAPPVVATKAPVPVLEMPALDSLLDAAEDKAVDFLVSVVDRVLRHPAVVTALHGLVRGAFEKDAAVAVDKTTATWTEQGPTARLPRVLVAGLTSKEKERAIQEYSSSLALRFWDEGTQSKGQLKQLLYSSGDVLVLPARVSHPVMQMIKSRVKKPPLYVDGYGDAAMRYLDQLAKQAVVQMAAADYSNPARGTT